MKRLADQKKEVEEEDLNEGLDNLSDVAMYYWPGEEGPSWDFTDLPMSPDSGGDDIGRVLSNRRFQKLFEEFQHLSPGEASRTISKRIELALEEYSDLYSKEVLEHPDLFDPDAPGQFGYFISDNADGSPTLAGSRMEIFALLTIAGNLNLDGVKPAYDKVLALALNQREFLYDREHVNLRLAYGAMHGASLYNRIVLSSAYSGIVEHGRNDHLDWIQRDTTRYNATISNFDTVTLYNVPPDFSMGSLHFQYVAAIDDAEFDALIRR